MVLVDGRDAHGGQGEGGLIAQLKSTSYLQVEQAMLDYSTVIQSSPLSIAHVTLMTAMESVSSSVSSTTTTTTTNFHPLNCMTWLRNIAMVMGMAICSGESSADYASLYGMVARRDLPLFDVLGGSWFTTDNERDLMCS